jgi:hypothetical protein
MVVVFVLNNWLTPPKLKSRKLFSDLTPPTLPSYQSGQNTQAARIPSCRDSRWSLLPAPRKKHHRKTDPEVKAA